MIPELLKQAQKNVLAIQGSLDAPGFDACVTEEYISLLEQELEQWKVDYHEFCRDVCEILGEALFHDDDSENFSKESIDITAINLCNLASGKLKR